MNITGTCIPTVILEAGMVSFSSNWAWVQPQLAKAELMAIASMSRSLSVGGNALLTWDSTSRSLIHNSGDLGDLPLIILTVTKQPLKGTEFTELQAQLPSLSTNSQHHTVLAAYHEGLTSQQHFVCVVSESVVRVIEAVRQGTSLAKTA